MGCAMRGTSYLLLPCLVALLFSSAIALQLELLDENIRSSHLAFSNRIVLQSEDDVRDLTVTHGETMSRLSSVILPPEQKNLTFRWMTKLPSEVRQGLRYSITRGESPGSQMEGIDITFDIPEEGLVPSEQTDFNVTLRCVQFSSVPVRFAFNIMAFTPDRQHSVWTVINMQKMCPTAGPPSERPRCEVHVPHNTCKKLCKKPSKTKLERIVCSSRWVMYGTYSTTNSRVSKDCHKKLHFTNVQALILNNNGALVKSLQTHAMAVNLPTQLTNCQCVKRLRKNKKYALLAIGEWKQTKSSLNVFVRKSVLLRKAKLRDALKELRCPQN